MQQLEHAADEFWFVIASSCLAVCVLHLKGLIESSDYPELSTFMHAAALCVALLVVDPRGYDVSAFL